MALKLLALGIDGAGWEVVGPLVERGALPNLAGMLQGGGHGTLQSIIPPLTPAAWSCLMTGVNPGRHGIYGFLNFDKPERKVRFTNGGDIKWPTFYEQLSAAGVRSGVINFPWTFPARQIAGCVVSGMDRPGLDTRAFHPPELLQEIREQPGDMMRQFEDKLFKEPLDLEDLRNYVMARGALARWLAHRCELDVLAVGFTAADGIQHHFLKQREVETTAGGKQDVVEYVYRLIDEACGQILEELCDADTHIVIFSDHGGTVLDGAVDVNLWLQELGLLKLDDAGAVAGEKHMGRVWLEWPKRLKRYLPVGLVRMLRPLLKEKRQEQWSSLLADHIAWDATTAVCTTEYGGIVVLDDQEGGGDSQARLHREAEALKDGQGHDVFERVADKEELFDGPHVSLAPDVFLQPHGYKHLLLTNWGRPSLLRLSAGGKVICEAPLQGGHTREGLYAVAGPGVSTLEAEASILDITPTILDALGVEPQPGMDGRSLL